MDHHLISLLLLSKQLQANQKFPFARRIRLSKAKLGKESNKEDAVSVESKISTPFLHITDFELRHTN